MGKQNVKRYDPEFKARVALSGADRAAVQGASCARRAVEEAAARTRFFSTWAAALPLTDKQILVQPDHFELSSRRQCELLDLTQSMLYYLPVGVSADDVAMMKEIDRLFTKWPFYGSRKLLLELRNTGHVVNRKRVQRLMQLMGLQALVIELAAATRDLEQVLTEALS